MITKSFILSSAGLKNLIFAIENENNFRFHFGEETLTSNKILAEFLCPLVSRLHQIDPTIEDIYYPYNNDILKSLTESKNDSSLNLEISKIFTIATISQLTSLLKGEYISITKEESNKLRLASIYFENEELFNQMNDLYPEEINEANIDSYIHNLSLLYHLSKKSPQYFNYNKVIDYISSHFFSIDKNSIKPLPKPILYSIISSEKLKLDDEDSLFDFIEQIFTVDQSLQDEEDKFQINDFIEKVDFNNLSEKRIIDELNLIDKDKIGQDLWNKIKKCFEYYKISKDPFNENRYAHKKLTFKFDGKESQAFKGIIHHLTEACGGNVHNNEIVTVKSSSTQQTHKPENACDFESLSIFHAEQKPNSWLMYDFKEKKVHPTHYTIRSRNDRGPDGSNPANWIIEGSNSGKDDDDWIPLDERKNIEAFKTANSTKTYEISNQIAPNQSFQYLRIRQNGLSANNNNWFMLSALEYFGDLYI